jgi:nitrite reductase (NAD(P)H)
MVLRKIQAMGVEVLTNCSPVEQLSRPAEDDPEQEVFVGFKLPDGGTIHADLVIYAIVIKPRDEIAKASGIECNAKGGIIVRDDLQTLTKDVYAIGECASWRSNTYGLIGPGSKSLVSVSSQRAILNHGIVEMADILSFNLTQTESHAPRIMNAPDLSTKLKYKHISQRFLAADSLFPPD